jgi:hypothetical protein
VPGIRLAALSPACCTRLAAPPLRETSRYPRKSVRSARSAFHSGLKATEPTSEEFEIGMQALSEGTEGPSVVLCVGLLAWKTAISTTTRCPTSLIRMFFPLANQSDPRRPMALDALRVLRGRGEGMFYTPQGLNEFWDICARPATARGGLIKGAWILCSGVRLTHFARHPHTGSLRYRGNTAPRRSPRPAPGSL